MGKERAACDRWCARLNMDLVKQTLPQSLLVGKVSKSNLACKTTVDAMHLVGLPSKLMAPFNFREY